jgi:hypothetical protein
MTRIVVAGAVLALLAAVLALWGGALGVTTVWPVLLAAAVGLALAPAGIGRILAFVVGAGVAWLAMAVRAGFLPDTGGARAIIVVGGVLLLTIIAAATRDLVPLWGGLAGYAAFAALYEPMYAASPTLFLTESPGALATVLLAGGLGFLAVAVADLVAPAGRSTAPALDVPLSDGEVS